MVDHVKHDLVVRNGVVVDGTGAPSRRADVAIDDGRITAVGEIDDTAQDEIDASGCLVTPGFVDPHTHLDAQLCWDSAATPTSLHGVATVVMGICGFGVAPCREGGGEYLLRSLEVVEEIPYASASLGVPFSWSTWGEFLDHLVSRAPVVNVAGMVPHSALRYFVMGERARSEPANDADRAALVDELRRSLADGALGFATSRGPNHNDAYGEPVPSRRADDDELRALVGECRGRPWQINVETKFAGDAVALTAEVERYAQWSVDAGARLTWSPFFAEPGDTAWRQILAHNKELNDRVEVVPQVSTQPVTTTMRFDKWSVAAVVVGWEAPMKEYFEADPSDRRGVLQADAFRRALRDAPEDCSRMLAPCYDLWAISSTTRTDALGRSLADAARAAGVPPTDFLCDLIAEDGFTTELQVPVVNRDAEGTAALVADDHTLIGLGDSGAHVTSVTGYTYPTHLLARLVRDEERLPLETAVHRITAHPARFFGISGRGELRPGFAADVCVVDLEHLEVGPLRVARDLPGGAPRLFRGASGYRTVIVNGEVTVRDDALTGASPGQAVRG
jgi:N-acyl-D-amino-acid deacylase